MAWQIQTVLPEVISSIPSTHSVAHNQLGWNVMPFSGVQTNLQAELSYTERSVSVCLKVVRKPSAQFSYVDVCGVPTSLYTALMQTHTTVIGKPSLELESDLRG